MVSCALWRKRYTPPVALQGVATLLSRLVLGLVSVAAVSQLHPGLKVKPPRHCGATGGVAAAPSHVALHFDTKIAPYLARHAPLKLFHEYPLTRNYYEHNSLRIIFRNFRCTLKISRKERLFPEITRDIRNFSKIIISK